MQAKEATTNGTIAGSISMGFFYFKNRHKEILINIIISQKCFMFKAQTSRIPKIQHTFIATGIATKWIENYWIEIISDSYFECQTHKISATSNDHEQQA